jgi:dienelactone hydrolase
MADLLSFRAEQVTLLGNTKTVYRKGTGPNVLIMTEVPNITPKVLDFADRVVAAGCSVTLPDLFGVAGRPPSNGSIAKTMLKACVSKEFRILATDASSPVTAWLRALAAEEHRLHGGPGVGAIGMCLTGGFALAMLLEPAVVAPVLSQPSLPVAIGRRGGELGLSNAEREAAVRRAREEGICVLGLRFTGDKAVPAARFAALRDLLGDAFIGVEIDSAPGNSGGYREGAHSVLTEDLDDTPGSATRAALDQVLAFFRDRLEVPA